MTILKNNFKKIHPFILKWWELMQDDPSSKADFAQLRRVVSAYEIAFIPSFYSFKSNFNQFGFEKNNAIAVLAALLAHVDENDVTQSLGAQFAEEKNNRPVVSELRFRRLLQVQDVQDLIHPFRRFIQQLKGKINIQDLSELICFWNNPEAKKKLAYQYFNKT